MPRLADFLTKHKMMNFFPTKSIAYLGQVTNEIVARRKANLDVRDDFIQIMIEYEDKVAAEEKQERQKREEQNRANPNNKEAKPWNGPLRKTLTVSERLSQSLQFLIAGYETTATALEFISYNLAMHQDVQDRLIQETDEILKKHVRILFFLIFFFQKFFPLIF